MIQKKSLKDAIQNPEIISVVGELIGTVDRYKNGLMPAGSFVKNYTLTFNGNGDGYKIGSSNADTFIFFKDGGYPCIIAITGNSGNNKYNVICGSLRPSVYEIKIIDGVACIISLSEEIKKVGINYFTLDTSFEPQKQEAT
jgi:hypothetical protein